MGASIGLVVPIGPRCHHPKERSDSIDQYGAFQLMSAPIHRAEACDRAPTWGLGVAAVDRDILQF
jgi:hypothetical protein